MAYLHRPAASGDGDEAGHGRGPAVRSPLGHGGIRAVARAAGVREATVSLGVDELDAGAEPLGRARRPGGGRKRAADLDPGLRPVLLALVEPEERGDPMSPLRWTVKSTRKLAGELTCQGHRVSADTVGDLLGGEGFSLQGNAKTIEGQRHPDRDEQFRYINEQVEIHQGTADPVVSVDTKKKELVGEFRNAGREWRPKGQPAATRTHDFPGDGRRSPPPAPRPAPSCHRRPVQRPARDDQQANPRHPPAPGSGWTHHSARPAPARQLRRPPEPGHRRGRHRPVRDQDSVLIICEPLKPSLIKAAVLRVQG